MNNKANNSKIYLEQDEKTKLLAEVKETVATDVNIVNLKEQVFSAADLWNIQKRKRNTNARRSTFWN